MFTFFIIFEILDFFCCYNSVRVILVNNKELKPNYTYGVNTNDKKAVLKAYRKAKWKHILISFLAFLVIGVLLCFVVDFAMVNFMDKKPYLALKEKVDYGTLYKGIGYKALYCDNGEIYKGIIDGKSCTDDFSSNSFKDVFYRNFMTYVKKKKILDETNLVKLDIINIKFDEYNDKGGSDYLVDFSYLCVDGSDTCFKKLKETENQLNVRLYVSINRNNEVYDIKTFKNTGEYYNELKKDYIDKVKNYYISNGKINVDKLRLFNIELIKNYGLYKYDGIIYADSYMINISYFCNDNLNDCVFRDDEAENSNYSFDMVMLLDSDNNVMLVKNIDIIE